MISCIAKLSLVLIRINKQRRLISLFRHMTLNALCINWQSFIRNSPSGITHSRPETHRIQGILPIDRSLRSRDHSHRPVSTNGGNLALEAIHEI